MRRVATILAAAVAAVGLAVAVPSVASASYYNNDGCNISTRGWWPSTTTYCYANTWAGPYEFRAWQDCWGTGRQFGPWRQIGAGVSSTTGTCLSSVVTGSGAQKR